MIPLLALLQQRFFDLNCLFCDLFVNNESFSSRASHLRTVRRASLPVFWHEESGSSACEVTAIHRWNKMVCVSFFWHFPVRHGMHGIESTAKKNIHDNILRGLRLIFRRNSCSSKQEKIFSFLSFDHAPVSIKQDHTGDSQARYSWRPDEWAVGWHRWKITFMYCSFFSLQTTWCQLTTLSS